MSSGAQGIEDAELAAAVWDLEPLVGGEGADGARALLDEAAARADEFAARYTGRVATHDGPGLIAAAQELSLIRERVACAFVYAELLRHGDLADAAAGSLFESVAQRRSDIEQTVRFFDLEWGALSQEAMERLLEAAGSGIDFAAHHLRRVHDAASEQLSIAEERVLSETAATSRVAWTRLAEELTSAVRFEVNGEEVGVGAIMSLREDPDRSVRKLAHEAFLKALEPGLATRAFAYNALLQGHATLDRLRGRSHWLDAQNRANEISGEAVQALIDAVLSRYDIAHRWFRLKAGLLGLERLADYDVMAPVGALERRYSYGEARQLVLDSLGSFSPQARGVVARFFEGGWIDAPPRATKFPGAFCEPEASGVQPYILLNYRGRFGDVMAMAHELGHGLHGVLAAPRGSFAVQAPTTVAETASTLAETLLLEQLVGDVHDDRERLAIIGRSIDGTIGTVFWQIAFTCFEGAAHTTRRAEGELAPEVLCDLYSQAMGDFFGDGVDATPGMGREWSIVPHFCFDVPGYVYSYAFGQLLALAAFARYREVGEPFVDDYLAMLAAGGSRSPHQLAAMIGVDLGDPELWNLGLDLIDARLREAETLAD